MATEEDKKFDAVLGGFLVNDLRGRSGHIHCPESDVLAAYHERSLLPEEMNSWKEHIVGCARCQAILVELEATDSIPLQVAEGAEENDAVVLTSAAEPVSFTGKDRDVAPATRPRKSGVVRISRRVRWQWLAPAGALAAGLLVWIAWHENQPLQVKAPAEVKTAKLEPPATPPSPAARQESRSSDDLTRLSKDQGTKDEHAAAGKPQEAELLKQLEKLDSRAKAAPGKPSADENLKRLEKPAPPADKERDLRRDAGREFSIAASRAQNRATLDAKAGVAGAAAENVEVQTQTANAQLQSQQNQLNEQKVPGPSPLSQAKPGKKNKPEAPAGGYRAAATPPAASVPAAEFGDVSVSRGLIAGGSHLNLIFAPNRKAVWRVGLAGLIEFSGDGGASWSRQTGNVSVDLTSGSAPSEKVCWIVGRAGTILLTADAGAHWTVLQSPLDEDLGGVRAADALHATIWDVGNTKAFSTADGGLTWKPAASQ